MSVVPSQPVSTVDAYWAQFENPLSRAVNSLKEEIDAEVQRLEGELTKAKEQLDAYKKDPHPHGSKNGLDLCLHNHFLDYGKRREETCQRAIKLAKEATATCSRVYYECSLRPNLEIPERYGWRTKLISLLGELCNDSPKSYSLWIGACKLMTEWDSLSPHKFKPQSP